MSACAETQHLRFTPASPGCWLAPHHPFPLPLRTRGQTSVPSRIQLCPVLSSNARAAQLPVCWGKGPRWQIIAGPELAPMEVRTGALVGPDGEAIHVSPGGGGVGSSLGKLHGRETFGGGVGGGGVPRGTHCGRHWANEGQLAPALTRTAWSSSPSHTCPSQPQSLLFEGHVN